MTATSWSLSELRNHIEANHPESDRILEVVSSMDRGVRIFRYHMATARDALKGIVNESEPADSENLQLLFNQSGQQGEFQYAKVVSEAHIIGCLHTARGLADLFGQLVNALVLVKPMSVAACDISKVESTMAASALKSRVSELLSSHWYRYVSAFINTTKHRQLIQHTLSVSFEENRAGIRVGAFSYGGQSFNAYWANEVLEGAIEVKNSLVACGRLLNAEVVN